MPDRLELGPDGLPMHNFDSVVICSHHINRAMALERLWPEAFETDQTWPYCTVQFFRRNWGRDFAEMRVVRDDGETRTFFSLDDVPIELLDYIKLRDTNGKERHIRRLNHA